MCVCPIDPHVRVGLLRCILYMQVQMLTLIYVYACPIDTYTCRHAPIYTLYAGADAEVRELSQLALIYIYACPIDPHTCRLSLMYTLYAGADAEVRELSQPTLIYVYVCPIDPYIRVGMP